MSLSFPRWLRTGHPCWTTSGHHLSSETTSPHTASAIASFRSNFRTTSTRYSRLTGSHNLWGQGNIGGKKQLFGSSSCLRYYAYIAVRPTTWMGDCLRAGKVLVNRLGLWVCNRPAVCLVQRSAAICSVANLR